MTTEWGAKEQVVNLALRLFSLGGKFVLTLYMGRFFDLSSMGAYGLVFVTVALATSFSGQELCYVVKREIVGLSRVDILHKIRDEAVWYGLNYVVIVCAAVVAVLTHAFDISTKYYLYAVALIVFEGFGTMCYNNMNLLSQQVHANFSLFVRTAAWVPIVIVLGIVDVSYRTDDVVLISWCLGSGLALLVPIWTWRHWGWKEVVLRPIAWKWILQGVRKSSLIWLGTIGAFGGSFIDRYIVNHYLSLEFVGVMTFYYSFANAMQTLVESGVLAFTGQRLVSHYKSGDTRKFHQEIRRAKWQTALGGLGIAALLGVAVPMISSFMNKPALVNEIGTFLLLLCGTWITCIDTVYYYILFAEHRDKPIWLGNILYLIPILGFNYFFISQYGFIGVGYSSVASSLLLLLWRMWFVHHVKAPSRLPPVTVE